MSFPLERTADWVDSLHNADIINPPQHVSRHNERRNKPSFQDVTVQLAGCLR